MARCPYLQCVITLTNKNINILCLLPQLAQNTLWHKTEFDRNQVRLGPRPRQKLFVWTFSVLSPHVFFVLRAAIVTLCTFIFFHSLSSVFHNELYFTMNYVSN